jgi:YD repeat-containing protein
VDSITVALRSPSNQSVVLPSDRYEYEIVYYREGEAYATVSGDINVVTSENNPGGALNPVYEVLDNGARLRFKGAPVTGVVIDGVPYNAVNGIVNLSSLARGNYTFTTVGADNNLVDVQLQKLSGALGGDFAIQTLDVGITYEIEEQQNYEFEMGFFSDKSRWHGQNRVRIELPFFDQISAGQVKYELKLEYKNLKGESESRIYLGNVGSDGVIVHIDIAETKDTDFAARLTKFVSIKLFTGGYEATPSFRETFDPFGQFHNTGTWLAEPSKGAPDQVVLLKTTGAVETQQLEFINLPTSAKTVKFAYRPVGSQQAYIETTLNKAGPGYFVRGNRDIPPGRYEYQIFINGSETPWSPGTGVIVIGSGITVNDSLSMPGSGSPDQQLWVTPSTTYRHDIFGNVVKEVRHANSSQTSTDGVLNVLADETRDHIVYTQFDSHSRAVQQIDAEGFSRYISYNLAGKVAREWAVVVDADNPQARRVTGNIYHYNAAGQRVEVITLAENHDLYAPQPELEETLATQQFEYNAFGEIVRQGLKENEENDGWQETFEYDNAGRMWRSNGEDGIYKIFIYDVQGNLIQRIQSKGEDLSGNDYDYSELEDTVTLPHTEIQKTSFHYDALGRVTQQYLPAWTEGSVTRALNTSQSYDRWGNVVSFIDTAGTETQYIYDQRDKMLQEIKAANVGVDVYGEDGNSSTESPTTHYHYDELGLSIGTTDARNNERVSRYNEAGEQTAAINAVGDVQRFVYDIFGNQAQRTFIVPDETNLTTLKYYDRNNRLVRVLTPGGGEALYAYDTMGNRIQSRELIEADEEESLYQVSYYRYDVRGNLIEEKVNASRWTYDEDGVLIDTEDDIYGGNLRRYNYDLRNNKILEHTLTSVGDPEDVSVTGNVELIWEYDYFGTLQSHTDLGGVEFQFEYNKNRQLTQKDQINNRGGYGSAQQDIRYDYYENGLLKTFEDLGPVVQWTETYSYDNAGRLAVQSAGAQSIYDYTYEYTYDELGRLSTYSADSDYLGLNDYYADITYTYDAVGNRRRVSGSEGTGSNNVNLWYRYDAENRLLISQGSLVSNEIVIQNNKGMELEYDALGNRTLVRTIVNNNQREETNDYDTEGRVIYTAVDGHSLSSRTYDKVGRIKTYLIWEGSGIPAEKEIQEYEYGISGRLETQTNYDFSTSEVVSTVSYDVYDDYGNILSYHVVVPGIGGYINEYKYEYDYFDSALVRKIDVTPFGTSQLVSGSVEQTYNINGALVAVNDIEDDDKDRTLIVNAQGQVWFKLQDGEHQNYYYANGTAIGSGGEIEDTDFDFNFTPVSDQYPAQRPGSYIVRSGDTLQSIAWAVYGDSSLWYLIADANGLTGDGDLSGMVNQTLRTPNVVSNVHNSADVFKPYNPAEIVGNVMPETPLAPPPKQEEDKSGQYFQIIIIVIAIVYGAYTGDWSTAANMVEYWNYANAGMQVLSGEATIYQAGASAAAGYIASQIPIPGIGSTNAWANFGGQVARGAVQGAIQQGILVASGTQEEFEWKMVAASALAAPIGESAGNLFNNDFINAAVSAAVSGAIQRNVGRQDVSTLDVFGNAIGNYVIMKGQVANLSPGDRAEYDSMRARGKSHREAMNHIIRTNIEFIKAMEGLNAEIEAARESAAANASTNEQAPATPSVEEYNAQIDGVNDVLQEKIKALRNQSGTGGAKTEFARSLEELSLFMEGMKANIDDFKEKYDAYWDELSWKLIDQANKDPSLWNETKAFLVNMAGGMLSNDGGFDIPAMARDIVYAIDDSTAAFKELENLKVLIGKGEGGLENDLVRKGLALAMRSAVLAEAKAEGILTKRFRNLYRNNELFNNLKRGTAAEVATELVLRASGLFEDGSVTNVLDIPTNALDINANLDAIADKQTKNVKNSSDNGIDIIAIAKYGAYKGKPILFEVKASKNSRISLQGDVLKGADGFGRPRLKAAANEDAPFTPGRVGPNVASLAEQMLRLQGTIRSFAGFVVTFTNFDYSNPRTLNNLNVNMHVWDNNINRTLK